MGTVALTSGPVRSNVRAKVAIAADHLFKYSSTENEVTTTGAGEPCHGIALQAVEAGEALNFAGDCHSTKHSGVYENVNCVSSYAAGNQFQSDASGAITTYSSGTACGCFLNSGSANDGLCKIYLYAR